MKIKKKYFKIEISKMSFKKEENIQGLIQNSTPTWQHYKGQKIVSNCGDMC